jgi:hypothetical protein
VTVIALDASGLLCARGTVAEQHVGPLREDERDAEGYESSLDQQEDGRGGRDDQHGPTTVARALARSSGAVQNCMTRLTKAKQVRQDSDKPRRYSLAA